MDNVIKVDLGPMPDEEPIETHDMGTWSCLRCEFDGLNPDCEVCGGTGYHNVTLQVMPPHKP